MPYKLERFPFGTQDFVHFELGIVTLSPQISERGAELKMQLVYETGSLSSLR